MTRTGGSFKALVIISPSPNTLEFAQLHNDNLKSTTKINVTYIPMLQYPPLHLAIMVAKDSPLMIDCPPSKGAGLSSAHSDLNAAIAKFRITAYMWQAMTVEDLRLKGLGRRTFRLDEGWGTDTLSHDFINARHDESLDSEDAVRTTAKTHVIYSSRTTKEIRDADVSQQNPSGQQKDALFDYFNDALKNAGVPFASSARPIVAGLILDSHYSMRYKLILGHAALGLRDPNGISLGIFGSHLCYSWPRFLEEVTSYLTDIKTPGDKVRNDNGECPTMWEACTIGQGAHLQEVGHTFGSPHRPGIMERGYAQDWPNNFLSKTAYSGHLKSEGVVVTNSTPTTLAGTFPMRFDAEYIGDEEVNSTLRIYSPVELRFAQDELEARFDRSESLSLNILGFNGKESTVRDVWKLLSVKTFIRIPGSSIRLFKRSVYSDEFEKRPNQRVYEWAQLLREKGADGNIHRATYIDLCVGGRLDGGVVKYADGHKSHWGPMRHGGQEYSFGGHASEEISIPANVGIKRIEVNHGDESSYHMDGIRMTLTNGSSAVELNWQVGRGHSIAKLEPAADEFIVGFYGKSHKESYCELVEFKIITAPKTVGLNGLPDAVFDLNELRNTCGMDGEAS